jgi:hypothetical protein
LQSWGELVDFGSWKVGNLLCFSIKVGYLSDTG